MARPRQPIGTFGGITTRRTPSGRFEARSHQRTDYQDILSTEGVQIESWEPFAEGKNGLFTTSF